MKNSNLKVLIATILIHGICFAGVSASASKAKSGETKSSKTRSGKASKAKQDVMGAKLGTDFNFDGSTVHGQYKAAFEGNAVAENDKPLDDILDYRKSMDDRIKMAKEQR